MNIRNFEFPSDHVYLLGQDNCSMKIGAEQFRDTIPFLNHHHSKSRGGDKNSGEANPGPQLMKETTWRQKFSSRSDSVYVILRKMDTACYHFMYITLVHTSGIPVSTAQGVLPGRGAGPGFEE
jgi:hypothetical protein